MIIYNSLEEFNMDCDTVVTVGKFDGLHRGHKILCENLFAMEKEGLVSLVISVIDTPIDADDKSPHRLIPDDKKIVSSGERLMLFRDSKISILIECPFDDKLRLTSPRDFIHILYHDLNMRCLVVGSDFRFGYKGAGDRALLSELSDELGFNLIVIDKLKDDDIDISSTRIRDEIKKGHIETANRLMGRNYFIYGRVTHGRQIGSKIDFPTINIYPDKDKLLPARGVYISLAVIEDKVYQGITNVGIRPTFDDGDELSIETHIINFDSDVYDKDVKIVFLKELRGEIRFDSVSELKKQLVQDKKCGMNFFMNEHFDFEV